MYVYTRSYMCRSFDKYVVIVCSHTELCVDILLSTWYQWCQSLTGRDGTIQDTGVSMHHATHLIRDNNK